LRKDDGHHTCRVIHGNGEQLAFRVDNPHVRRAARWSSMTPRPRALPHHGSPCRRRFEVSPR
jgi:hypothetical protein